MMFGAGRSSELAGFGAYLSITSPGQTPTLTGFGTEVRDPAVRFG